LPTGRPDVVFLPNDLNSDLGRSCDMFCEKSALIFSRTSRDRAVEAFCTEEGTATDSIGGPPINRTAWGGVDPIPRLPTSLSLPLPSLSLSCSRRSDLVTALLPRAPVQLPAPAEHALAPPLRAIILLRMRVKTLCHIRSTTNPSGEMAADGASIQDPQAAWVRSTMTEAKIQALVDRGLLRPKAEVEWRAAAGE
jgi:hypothetical protein